MTIKLPRTVDVDALAEAVRSVQANARSRLCTDPQTLARRVLVQLGRLEEVAFAADTVIPNLWAHGHWWENHGERDEGDVTLVQLVPEAAHLEILRGPPPSATHNGRVYLHLKDRTQ